AMLWFPWKSPFALKYRAPLKTPVPQTINPSGGSGGNHGPGTHHEDSDCDEAIAAGPEVHAVSAYLENCNPMQPKLPDQSSPLFVEFSLLDSSLATSFGMDSIDFIELQSLYRLTAK